jgi:hypothetical protein
LLRVWRGWRRAHVSEVARGGVAGSTPFSTRHHRRPAVSGEHGVVIVGSTASITSAWGRKFTLYGWGVDAAPRSDDVSGFIDRCPSPERQSAFAAAVRRHDSHDSKKTAAEVVVRSYACSSTCQHMRRFKKPPPSGNRSDGASAAVLNEVLRAGRDNFRDRDGDNGFRVSRCLPDT